MVGAPSGTVTFLFTDIEGSTRQWEVDAAAMNAALARHDAIVRDAVDAHGGVVFATGGDGVAAAFSAADDGVSAAVEVQRALAAETWPDGVRMRVRMGLHTGAAHERDGDYFGPVVNRTARLMAIGHGGQVLLSGVTAGLASRSDVPLVDLGEHRMKDLLEPEHVWQVDLGETHPPLRSLGRRGGRLPVQLTAFVGRERELGETMASIREHRVTTLVGVGGMGKTRLALQAAAELVDELPDGAWFVDLAPVSSPSGVAEAVASALGVDQTAASTPMAAVVDAVSGWHALVVIDNCEHVLDAAASAVRDLVGAGPSLRVLATSREGLGITGEQIVPVGPLAVVADADGSVPDRADAVTLLVDRVGEHRPDQVWDDPARAAAIEICSRLDGIPLAIELAAARSRSMTLPEIASRLDERFRLLTRGARGAVSRHQTLQAAVAWSHDLLTEEERRVWEWCSVFAGGFELDAAESVCGGAGLGPYDVLDALDGLVGRSLVIAGDRRGVTRYRMLETIRQFGIDLLGRSGELQAAADAHLSWTTALMGRVGESLCRPGDLPWFDRLTAELGNHTAAVDHAASTGRWVEVAALLRPIPPGPLFGVPQGVVIARLARRLADELGEAARRETWWAPLGVWASFDCFHQADFEAGKALARSAIALVRDEPYEQVARLVLWCNEVFSGDVEGMVASALDVSAAAERYGDDYLSIDAQGMRSLAFNVSGRPDDALVEARSAVARARAHGCENLLMRQVQFLGLCGSLASEPVVDPADLEAALVVASERRSTYFFGSLVAASISHSPDPRANLEFALRAVRLAVDCGQASALCQAMLQVARGLHGLGREPEAVILLGFAERGITATALPVLAPLVEVSRRTEMVACHERGQAMRADEAVDLAERASAETLGAIG